MTSTHVYDKAKYHDDTVQQHGLPEEHAANHTVFFLRWLIERDLVSPRLKEEVADRTQRFHVGEASVHQLYESWDRCFVDDMLSDVGNAFAAHYFDFERGAYMKDYVEALQGDLPTEFHVQYTDANYEKIKSVIDRRYAEWTAPAKPSRRKKWWPF